MRLGELGSPKGMNIEITRFDGGLYIKPGPPYLIKYLRYNHRSMGMKNYRRVPIYEERLLHVTDTDGGIITLQGYYEIVCNLIHKNFDTFTVIDNRTKMPDIDWQAVKDIGVRDYQIDPVVEFLMKGMDDSGIIKASGGFGKTHCQAFTYAAWNKLNTILAIPLKQVFIQTYEKFCKLFPDKHIGRVGGGYHDISQDITITTFKSLPKCALEKCQLFLVDELQSSTGEAIQEVFSSFKPTRTFGYTATDDGLFNQADKVIKGLFGERLIEIPYDEALEMGAVVPGVVYFVRTPDCIIPSKSFDVIMRQGINRCEPRNRLISKISTLIPDKWQAIVFVDHVKDHLIRLHQLMPVGTKYVHRNSNKKEIGDYALTNKQQQLVVDEFSRNEFQVLIATDSMRAGVDIPNCRVVIQGAGGASSVEILQEAFRGSRVLTEERRLELDVEPKTHMVVVDFLDNHDPTLERLAMKRMDIYKSQGWTIRIVDKPEDIDWRSYKDSL